MKTTNWNDGRLSRGRKPRLFVGRGETVAEFAGVGIPGVVAVVREDYEKNGKWSNTTFGLAQADDGWALAVVPDFESGKIFHGTASLDEVVAQFRAVGCTADSAGIVGMLEVSAPNLVARLRAVAAETAGW